MGIKLLNDPNLIKTLDFIVKPCIVIFCKLQNDAAERPNTRGIYFGHSSMILPHASFKTLKYFHNFDES